MGISAENAPYPLPLIKQTIREWHYLPATNAVLLDIRAVYPWLGKEYQDLFDLYAAGYTLRELAAYWARIHRRAPYRTPKRTGHLLVERLTKRIAWLLSLVVHEAELHISCQRTTDV